VSDNVCTVNFKTVTRNGNRHDPQRDREVGDRPSLLADLKLAIIQSGKTQMAVARACGIHFTKLSMIIHGWRVASAAERACIAAQVGRDESDLFPEGGAA
jgi:hypothetical protein